ncbi:hypothetical protein D9M72_512900 [compost metagenome]
MEQPHDPGNVGGGAADGQLVAADVEVHGRKLLFDETQRLIVAAERLNHLFGVVEDDHLRPDTGKTMGKFTCGALSGAEPGPSVCCFSHGAGLRASGPLQLGIVSLRPITSPLLLLQHRAPCPAESSYLTPARRPGAADRGGPPAGCSLFVAGLRH